MRLLHACYFSIGAGIRLLGVFVPVVRRSFDIDLVAKVIERQQPVKKHQHTVGNVEIVFRLFSNALQLADNIVGEESDRTRSERRKTRYVGRAVLGQQVF